MGKWPRSDRITWADTHVRNTNVLRHLQADGHHRGVQGGAEPATAGQANAQPTKLASVQQRTLIKVQQYNCITVYCSVYTVYSNIQCKKKTNKKQSANMNCGDTLPLLVPIYLSHYPTFEVNPIIYRIFMFITQDHR